MPEEERGALITAIHLKKNYGLSYLEDLCDKELVNLYDQLFAV
ncbi:hypothetical protein ABZ756_13630 [Mammaliicoccus sciuri]|uniref:Uncharacterized protein n=1 Tax=Sporosarcina newyorkensis TaxID=759851 RepID=A0A1T4YVE7_9BACL|nr:hypothetical protein [Sporosarcina newyorkensis]SKB05215.1 hypothetical protein SAMN04244570_3588 [Sporosarcina newyorkensis]